MHKKYAKALFDLIKDKSEAEVEKTFEDFLRYLKEKQKIKLLPKIMAELEKLYQKAAKSAPKLYIAKEEDAEKVAKKAEAFALAKTVIVKDPEIIGGFKIKTKDFIFDASFKRYLLDLYETLRK